MATFVLIHGAGDVGWYWHLVEAELRRRGHDTVAPDLPCDDDTAGLTEYADAVISAVGASTGNLTDEHTGKPADNRTGKPADERTGNQAGERTGKPADNRTGKPTDERTGNPGGGRTGKVVVVGQSLGGFTAPLVCERLRADLLVLVAPMIPAPGESVIEYWRNTGYDQEPTGDHNGTIELFYQDVPPALAAEAVERGKNQSDARMGEPSPLTRWPDVPTRVVLCRDDRLFPPRYLRRVAAERLGVTPDEIEGGHTPALSRPRELAALLDSFLSR
ncbi:alpha/beta fold hydrolase [Paractinoplanes brasiliensis]|uniref:Alpha/beta hydrolase family protein n=1 Tax=Paractinoplanes brasiliensis TaxID=52695 RepID=A0A4R6J875_9ACTN|nr:alpha/beta hydrolase [Actinoplanes brasiliensis]TDO31652.1 alpha/beta hydrolase family protein [Actinoplanes brasiliensis]GID30756.1 alpha/beta hydrolase [Actinoplanes brasiliensis]